MKRFRSAAALVLLGSLILLSGGGAAVKSASAEAGVTHLSQRVALLSFRMATPMFGWAVSRTQVLRTTDSGRSWLNRTPAGLTQTHSGPGLAGGQPTNIANIGPNAFWIAVSAPGRVQVFGTLDAGAHWRLATINPSAVTGLSNRDVPMVLGLVFIDARDGWLLISNGGIATGSEDVEIYRTVDAGTRWSSVAVATQAHASPGGLPAGGVKTGLGFVSSRRGWLTGYQGEHRGIWLYRTDDSGKTWHAATLPTPTGYPASGQFPLTFPPLFSGAVGVLPVLWPSKQATVFYTTRDGGLHWQPSSPLPSPGGNALQAWAWTKLSHEFAISRTRFCRKSAAPPSWQCKPEPTTLKGVSELQFRSNALGWALADGQLLRTTTGGLQWSLP